MQSEDRIEAALAALAAPIAGFRSAIVASIEEVRGYLARHNRDASTRVERLRAELGPFAADCISVERLAVLIEGADGMDDPAAAGALRAALAVLEAALAQGSELHVLRIEPGRGLVGDVERALAEVGRVFGAARAVELVRRGGGPVGAHEECLPAFPFARWSRGERRMAPPLIVEVDGADLHCAGLADFLDGSVKLVLIVRGGSPPAPLARLVAPGTFVAQTVDGSALGTLANADGPGIAALVPESAARFIHDPAGGPEMWQRLSVQHLPAEKPRRAIGGLSAEQQARDLAHLSALAAAPPTAALEAGPGASTAPAAADPVDKLAAWLLHEARLGDGG